jgi:gas vesicle protein
MARKNRLDRDPGRGGTARGLLIGLLTGGLVGAGVMLFSAPQAGAKTRQQVRKRAIELRDMAGQGVQDVRSRAEDMSDEISKRATDLQSRSRTALKESEKRLSRASKEARKAARALTNG